MTIRFYRWDRRSAPPPRLPLPPGLEVRTWRPAIEGPPPHGSRRLPSFAWWALDALRLFARRDLAEISLWRDGRRLHRLLVTPRWRRFPFMAANDLQIGDLWTHPEARRQGLAQIAIGEAHHGLAEDVEAVWYVVRADNPASIRLIESTTYRLVGVGRRTRPFGLRALGRYLIEKPGP